MVISKAAKAAKAGLVYTKMDHPSYITFLKQVTKSHNKKAVILQGKTAFDAEYSSQLRKQYGHDEGTVRAHLQEINSKTNIAAWNDFVRRCAQREKGQEILPVIDPKVGHFKIPTLATHHKSTRYDSWDRQTYQDFAVKVEKDNGGVTFTKQLMDDCFRVANSRVKSATSGSASNNVSREKALKRCLGKESEDYWKDR